ncbi:hypothetical protein ACJJTC_017343, partial [Scirpophaga incertulas]
MIENSLKEFSNNLIFFICGKNQVNRGMLVKKHSEHFDHYGEFSFPLSIKSWHYYLSCDNGSIIGFDRGKTVLDFIGKVPNDLIKESSLWRLQILKVFAENDRLYLFLDRSQSLRIALSEALNNNSQLNLKMGKSTGRVLSDNNAEDDQSITSLRRDYLLKSVDNLIPIVEDRISHNYTIVVSSRSAQYQNGQCLMLCGAVLNAKSGAKETKIKADDYIRLRQGEMTLIAQHKYGVRVSSDENWREFLSHLGEAAAAFELLQTKPSSAVKINFECSSAGSSKGAAFVLYNCARLETLIRSFNSKVNEGVYPSLPKFEDIDFSLLTHEEEWTLVFNYIMGFPLLLENCVTVSESSAEFRPHLICSFLCSMVRVFSQYYRKVRILTEPRSHLLPVLYARVHMLKILNDTLKTCLNILNIKKSADFDGMAVLFVAEAEHGYASTLPVYEEARTGGRRPKTKKSQGSRTTHNELEKN